MRTWTLPRLSSRRGPYPDRGRALDINGYLRAISEAGLAPASRARRLSALRQLYKFLTLEDVVEEDPTHGIGGPKQGRALPKTLSVAEVDGCGRG